MQAGGAATPLGEANRRLAFQGNSAVFGVQARVRMGAQLLAPSTEDPLRLDVAILSGFGGFRRLRTAARWPLTREIQTSEDPDAGPRTVEPIDPEIAPGTVPLIAAFSTHPLPPIRPVPNPGGTLYELGEGPVGNTAALDCVFGRILRRFAAPRASGREKEQRGEYLLGLDLPVERMLFDLLVQRDLPFRGAPVFDFYRMMQGGLEFPLTHQPHRLLPRGPQVETLGTGALGLSTTHWPRHAELLRLAAERLGRALEEFRGYRVCVTYPPIPTQAIYHYDLPA
jgi:hypothetical protein